MVDWVKTVEVKAMIIHEQLSVARRVAVEGGIDPEEISRPYLDLLQSLYRDELGFAQLAELEEDHGQLG